MEGRMSNGESCHPAKPLFRRSEEPALSEVEGISRGPNKYYTAREIPRRAGESAGFGMTPKQRLRFKLSHYQAPEVVDSIPTRRIEFLASIFPFGCWEIL